MGSILVRELGSFINRSISSRSNCELAAFEFGKSDTGPDSEGNIYGMNQCTSDKIEVINYSSPLDKLLVLDPTDINSLPSIPLFL
jgi:hypothetical protein